MNAERMKSKSDGSWDDAPGGDDCAQRLSCLLDGELDSENCAAILERLRRDEEACQRWAMLNCVGDALRSAEVAAWHAEGFVARVSAALENEPTVLAPAARAPKASLHRWLLPGVGAAAAAAVLIVVGLPARQANAPDAVVAAKKAAPPAVVVVPPGSAPVDRSPQLERYLAAHRELAEPGLMPHSMPYVRTSGMPQVQGAR